MSVEAGLLEAARAHGVPVTQVVACGEGEGLGARWLVLSHVGGETIPRKILRDPER
ncbi:MAG: hypothetical protein ACYCV7_08560 [Acidimicrobiales bacterium]